MFFYCNKTADLSFIIYIIVKKDPISPMQPRFTVIIPHYQQPSLLKRCLDSLPKRDDVQVIVSDDASSEDAISQIREMTAGFELVTSDRNQGGGHARNAALVIAKGEYVIFADADDEFITAAFDDILDEAASDTQATDIFFFNATARVSGTDSKSYRAARLNWIMNQKEQAKADLLRFVHSEPWCKIVRRKLIIDYNLRFDETPILNDVRFSYMAGFHAKTIKVIEKCGYCVNDLPQSTGKRMTTQRKVAYTKVLAEANRFFEQNNLPHHYDNVLRPLMLSLTHGQWNDARLCYQTLKDEGLSNTRIWCMMAAYPVAICHWVGNKIKYRNAAL